jgi:hypothetical protein
MWPLTIYATIIIIHYLQKATIEVLANIFPGRF